MRSHHPAGPLLPILLCAALLGAAAGADTGTATDPAAAGADTGTATDSAADDPRLLEAADWLAGPEGFERATDLYRAVLADFPDSAETRLQLARVLSWSGRFDESIAEYDALLAREDPPATTRVERAEVLSWAGRLEEARAEFESLLAENPDDARAARGVARTWAWAGRVTRAERAYARALELEEDPEARGELVELVRDQPPETRVGFAFAEDSDHFQHLSTTAEGAVQWGRSTRITTRASSHWVEDPHSAALGGARDDHAFGLEVELFRPFGESVEGAIALGGRLWDRAGAIPRARGRLAWTSPRQAVVALDVDHGEFFERSDSLAAVFDDIRDTTASFSVWKGMSRGLEAYASAAASFLSDSNRRQAFGGSVSWTPWDDVGLRADLGASFLRYEKATDLYYDPESDFGGILRLSLRRPLGRHVTADVHGAAGYGAASQDGATGRGFSYEFGGELLAEIGPWQLALRGTRSQSRRRTAYVSTRLSAHVGFDF